MRDIERRISRLERASALRKQGACQFCGDPPIQVLGGKAVSFSCGTRANDPSPGTVLCWTGWVMNLQKKITALESMTQVRPGDLTEAVCYTAHLHGADWWKRLRGALPKDSDSPALESP